MAVDKMQELVELGLSGNREADAEYCAAESSQGPPANCELQKEIWQAGSVVFTATARANAADTW